MIFHADDIEKGLIYGVGVEDGDFVIRYIENDRDERYYYRNIESFLSALEKISPENYRKVLKNLVDSRVTSIS